MYQVTITTFKSIFLDIIFKSAFILFSSISLCLFPLNISCIRTCEIISFFELKYFFFFSFIWIEILYSLLLGEPFILFLHKPFFKGFPFKSHNKHPLSSSWGFFLPLFYKDNEKHTYAQTHRFEYSLCFHGPLYRQQSEQLWPVIILICLHRDFLYWIIDVLRNRSLLSPELSIMHGT